MGFVHDHGEPLPRQLADLAGDDRELLERRDDDGLAFFQGLLELAGSGVDVLDHAQGLLELEHRGLKLAVENAPVGHHHDRVEDPTVLEVVKGGEAVGQPGDGVALAAPRGVLDQVELAGATLSGVGHELPHRVELLVARKDQEAPAGLLPVLVLVLHLLDELADEVEDAVPGPQALPEVGGGVALLRG